MNKIKTESILGSKRPTTILSGFDLATSGFLSGLASSSGLEENVYEDVKHGPMKSEFA